MIRSASTLIIEFENCHECLLGHFHIAHLAHAFFPFLLFFKQLAFPGDITPVAFSGNVFAEGFNCFTGNDFGTNTCLDGNVELLTGDELSQLGANTFAEIVGIVAVYKG